MKNSKVFQLTETAIMLALSTVLSLISVVKMPFGGDVTACSMLPMIILAYRYGAGYGFISCGIYGLIQLLLGLDNLSYCTSFAAVIAVIFLDYVIAFGACGLAGIFKNNKSQANALIFGSLLVCAVRFICHFISGCTVWAGLSIPDTDALVYSLAYNSAYMLPETIITVAGAYYLGQVIDFKSKVPTRSNKIKASFGLAGALGLLCFVVAVVADVMILFKQVQTDEGFDITLISGANYGLILIIFIAGAAAFLITYFIDKLIRNKKAF